jgi:hypothetical protein
MKSVSEEKFRLTPTESQLNGGEVGDSFTRIPLMQLILMLTDLRDDAS